MKKNNCWLTFAAGDIIENLLSFFDCCIFLHSQLVSVRYCHLQSRVILLVYPIVYSVSNVLPFLYIVSRQQLKLQNFWDQ